MPGASPAAAWRRSAPRPPRPSAAEGSRPTWYRPSTGPRGSSTRSFPVSERGDAVLLVRAAEARDVLPRELEARGSRVAVVPAYRTAFAGEGAGDVLRLLEARRIDAVTFTSSSTVRGFVALLAPAAAPRLLDGVVVAAIGPITADTAAAHGLHVAVMPNEYTVPALADAVAGHFETTSPAALRG